MTESIHDNGGADEPLVGTRISFDEQAACLAQELDSFSRQPEEDARIEALIREDIASRIGTGLDFDVVVCDQKPTKLPRILSLSPSVK